MQQKTMGLRQGAAEVIMWGWANETMNRVERARKRADVSLFYVSVTGNDVNAAVLGVMAHTAAGRGYKVIRTMVDLERGHTIRIAKMPNGIEMLDLPCIPDLTFVLQDGDCQVYVSPVTGRRRDN